MIQHTQTAFTPWALFWGLVAVVVVYLLHFGFLWIRGHHAPHIKALLHFHYHLITGLVVALFVGIFVGVTIYRGLGLKYNSRLHIKPNPQLVQAGAAAPYSYSLEKYLPPVLNQGNSLACVAFASTEARYTEHKIRGESPPDAFSPWFTYYWATRGANRTTSIDEEALSIINHGTTLFGNMPYFGSPSYNAINTAVQFGGSYRYLFYNFGGQNSVDTIKASIVNGQPVILLMAVNSDFANAFNGNNYTDNYGGFVGYHGVVVYGYEGNNLFIRNSWGTNFGAAGNIVLSARAVFHTVIGAAVISASPRIVYNNPPPPVPTITPRPQPTPLPTATSTPKPVRTSSPHLYKVTVQTHLRFQPRLNAGVDPYLVKRGYSLIDLVRDTPHWHRVTTLTRKHTGWIWKADIKRSR